MDYEGKIYRPWMETNSLLIQAGLILAYSGLESGDRVPLEQINNGILTQQ